MLSLTPGHHPWSGHHITWRKYSEYLWADWAGAEIYVDTDWGEGSDHHPSHVRRGWSPLVTHGQDAPAGMRADQADQREPHKLISADRQGPGGPDQPGLAFS